MYYLGLRSSGPYLSSLSKIRHLTTPHTIISIIGGGAFIHALSRYTHSLWLIDTDPDALVFWQLIKELIQLAPSRAQFFSFLSGWDVHPSLAADQPLFLYPTNHRPFLHAHLTKESWQTYCQTFGSIKIDPSTNRGKINDSTILFRGSDLTPMHFAWHCGEMAWESEESFQVLRTALFRLSITATSTGLESLASEYQEDAVPTLWLASNAESPLFTKSDKIIRQLRSKITKPCHYVSWARDAMISPLPIQPIIMQQAAWPRYQTIPILSLDTDSKTSSMVPFVTDPTQMSLNQLQDTVCYNQPGLVIQGGDPHNAITLIEELAPSFRTICWITDKELICSLPLQSSYTINMIQGPPRGFLFELVGAR
jgi:hypothetical protein